MPTVVRPVDSTHVSSESKTPEVRTALSAKQPPPEPPIQIARRRWLLFAFWAVVIFLGLPTWFWTTSVYRAPLPLKRMNQWAAGQGCQFEFPIHVALDAPSLSSDDIRQLVKLTQQTVDDHDDVASIHHLRFDVVNDHSSVTPDLTIVLRPTDTTDATDSLSRQPYITTLQSYAAVLDIRHPAVSASSPVQTASTLTLLAKSVAEAARNMFADEQTRLVHLFTSSNHNIPASQRPSETDIAWLNQRSARSLKYAPTYHLTFSLFTGSASPVDWDIRTALEEYLEPLLASFKGISTFTIDTQVQYYASLSPSLRGPVYDEERAAWTLEQSDLSGFINAAEWPLSPSIGQAPTVNFVLYVPPPKQSPLYIKESRGTSWLIPQWGGVKILNRSPETADILTKSELDSIVLGFTDQLVSLLGLPQTPPSLPLRLSSLTRERASGLILSASSTLGALSRLTLKLTSIAIPDNVAASVNETISRLEQACSCLREARYDDALSNARIAEYHAEKAFFDPSMVGQVYFPDEHKVAVYVPLLGPMAVPLLTAVVKEFRTWSRSRGSG